MRDAFPMNGKDRVCCRGLEESTAPGSALQAQVTPRTGALPEANNES